MSNLEFFDKQNPLKDIMKDYNNILLLEHPLKEFYDYPLRETCKNLFFYLDSTISMCDPMECYVSKCEMLKLKLLGLAEKLKIFLKIKSKRTKELQACLEKCKI